MRGRDDYTTAFAFGETMAPEPEVPSSNPPFNPYASTFGSRSLDLPFLGGRGSPPPKEGGAEVPLTILLIDTPLSPTGLSRTYGGQSATGADAEEDRRALKNRRRLWLIDRKYAVGLSAAEAAELESLQEEVLGQTSARFPLPTETLDRLEALVDQLEAAERQP